LARYLEPHINRDTKNKNYSKTHIGLL